MLLETVATIWKRNKVLLLELTILFGILQFGDKWKEECKAYLGKYSKVSRMVSCKYPEGKSIVCSVIPLQEPHTEHQSSQSPKGHQFESQSNRSFDRSGKKTWDHDNWTQARTLAEGSVLLKILKTQATRNWVMINLSNQARRQEPCLVCCSQWMITLSSIYFKNTEREGQSVWHPISCSIQT